MESITVSTTINAPISKVWEFYTQSQHVTKWNNASPDWHTPKAENDLRVGGKFTYRMEPIGDSTSGFDFSGIYDTVKPMEYIEYTMEDGRKVSVTMNEDAGKTKVVVVFDPENENPIEMQRDGWQAILDNFKKYVESN